MGPVWERSAGTQNYLLLRYKLQWLFVLQSRTRSQSVVRSSVCLSRCRVISRSPVIPQDVVQSTATAEAAPRPPARQTATLRNDCGRSLTSGVGELCGPDETPTGRPTEQFSASVPRRLARLVVVLAVCRRSPRRSSSIDLPI